MVSYAALDKQGNLIPGLSRDPHYIDDPASITKLWTLYTLVDIMEKKKPGGWKEFYKAHEKDVNLMLIKSSNDASERLAIAASGSIPAFTKEMNERAVEAGALRTNFVTVNGLPASAHYSTAYDMARMMHKFQQKYPNELNLAGQTERDGIGGNTGKKMLASEDIIHVKTGTAAGTHGASMLFGRDFRKSGLGGTTSGGSICVLGASIVGGERDRIMRGLAYMTEEVLAGHKPIDQYTQQERNKIADQVPEFSLTDKKGNLKYGAINDKIASERKQSKNEGFALLKESRYIEGVHNNPDSGLDKSTRFRPEHILARAEANGWKIGGDKRIAAAPEGMDPEAAKQFAEAQAQQITQASQAEIQRLAAEVEYHKRLTAKPEKENKQDAEKRMQTAKEQARPVAENLAQRVVPIPAENPLAGKELSQKYIAKGDGGNKALAQGKKELLEVIDGAQKLLGVDSPTKKFGEQSAEALLSFQKGYNKKIDELNKTADKDHQKDKLKEDGILGEKSFEALKSVNPTQVRDYQQFAKAKEAEKTVNPS